MSIGTEYTRREPRGFGAPPFGDPTETALIDEKEFRMDGFGDVTTKYTEYEND